MPRKHVKGWCVMQMMVRDEEYKEIIQPRLKESGLSESSYLRMRCELPISERASSRVKRKAKSSVKSTHSGAQKKSPQRRTKQSKKPEELMPFNGRPAHAREVEESGFLDIQPDAQFIIVGEVTARDSKKNSVSQLEEKNPLNL